MGRDVGTSGGKKNNNKKKKNPFSSPPTTTSEESDAQSSRGRVVWGGVTEEETCHLLQAFPSSAFVSADGREKLVLESTEKKNKVRTGRSSPGLSAELQTADALGPTPLFSSFHVHVGGCRNSVKHKQASYFAHRPWSLRHANPLPVGPLTGSQRFSFPAGLIVQSV